ncbi:stage VI sporulation protein F [Paenibacillus turpanensis]|uniref:stage VI sporulation protein F n=1 Tax=Paenibacillus turpanensis TaxID=2689078 RepID=UPI00140A75F3|nr:stage VI sporulation protein F [Paenibacillus turpanensis]
MSKNISKDVLNVVKKKTGKAVTERDIKKLAGAVKPSTMQSEAELRKLIKQVSSMVGVPVPESTANEIVSAIKKSGGTGNLEQVMKMMMKK